MDLASGRRSQLAKVALRKVHMERVATTGLMAAPGAVVPGLVSAAADEGYRPQQPASFSSLRQPPPSMPPPPSAAARQVRPKDPSEEFELLELDELEPAPPSAPPVRVQPVMNITGSPPKYIPVPEAASPEPEPAGPPPLLLDVTPLSLGVETVGGFCHTVIPRNTAMPAENTQTFSTGRDGQTFISVRICQGEEKSLESNQVLGVVELDGLRDAARGSVRIDVTFVIDADGALAVQARDLETGREQAVRIRRVGELDESELDALRDRMEARFRRGGEVVAEDPRP